MRHAYAGQPTRMHRALQALSQPAPAQVPPTSRQAGRFSDQFPSSRQYASRNETSDSASTLPTPVTVCPAALLGVPPDQEAAVRRFVDHVRDCVAREPLVNRHSLLRVAQRLQIGRFHANLVIAAVLHERPDRVTATRVSTPPSHWSLLAAIAVTQGALLSVILFTYRWLMTP